MATDGEALLRGYNPLDVEIEAKLDPEFMKYYNEVIDRKPSTHQVPLNEIRTNPQKFAAPGTVPIPENERIKDSIIKSMDGYDIPIRIYYPKPDSFGPGPHGVHLNFHGNSHISDKREWS